MNLDANYPFSAMTDDAKNDAENESEETSISLDDPSLYFQRELSLLQFQRRVLALAQDPAVPLLERLRFLTICSTNLDEFFEVRVSGLQEQHQFGVGPIPPTKMLPQTILEQIDKQAHQLVHEQYATLQNDLLPALAENGIRILKRSVWNDQQRAWVRKFFTDQVLPVLTPMGLDPSHPFPRIRNKSLNFIITVKGKDAFARTSGIAVVQVPRCLPRVIEMPNEVAGDDHTLVLLSAIVHANVEQLFHGMQVTGCYAFRVTRNSDLWIEEEEVEDLLHALKGELPTRRYGQSVRLEVADSCSEEMANFLLERFQLTNKDLYRVNGPVNLHRLQAVCDLIDRPDLKYEGYVPSRSTITVRGESLFERIRQGDILLHHPFESFTPVLDMVRAAASDPKVLAIKMTLYRTGPNSPLVEALIDAVRSGKEVTAVVELRARFDEAANIDLATMLQEAGATVVYGIVGYKTHSKMLLIVRRDQDGLRRYVHLGTGNYHYRTARFYTDLSFITAKPEISHDVHQLFMQLTGLGQVLPTEKILHSPFTLQKTVIQYIDDEIANAKAGKPAWIKARMNSLSDAATIKALYRASQAGVKIELVIRGICCLKPGVPGVSENITVRSILGRYLEHTRVYCFCANGEKRTYIASADWMPRNLYRRAEAASPIEDPELKQRVIHETLDTYLEDNTQSWELQSDGQYVRQKPAEGEKPHSAQLYLQKQMAD